MAFRVLQGNLNHCAAAQDLFVQSMVQWSVQAAVVAEPYSVPPRDSWIGDRDGVVAVVTQVAAGSSPFSRIERGSGCVAALLGGTAIVGVYFSPNRPVSEFQEYLGRVEAIVGRFHPFEVLVLGDLNAKSRMWGSPATDAKGAILEEWVVATGLTVLNRGSVDTCVRQAGGSIVDVSFASPSLARRVQGWRVLDDVETLSDHRYLRMEISTRPAVPPGPRRASDEDGPRWQLKRLDKELLELAAIVASCQPHVEGSVESMAERLSGQMTDMCDAAMPRWKGRPQRSQVYWWSEEIAQLRRDCVAVRRQYLRCRRRMFRTPPTSRNRVRHEEDGERLYALYTSAKSSLRVAISEAKAAAWEEMLDGLNRDPWGTPYKRVRDKLRPWAPPLTQTLDPEAVCEVVAALFPASPATAEYQPPRMAPPLEEDGVIGEEAPEVSRSELEEVVARLARKRVAPGLDGVPGTVWVEVMKHLEPRVRGLFTACLAQSIIPQRWKTGRMVLLRKAGRPAESPSSYRPIVLLDEIAKLFERVVAGRLVAHLGRRGTDLSDVQFGFRRGRSTMDAVLCVQNKVRDAVARGDVVVAVSLDIANAFNTLPWSCIREALRYHGVPNYLRRIVGAYLSDRWIVYKGREGVVRRQVVCGVPQGSVLGPLLWNIGYDWVLRGVLLRGVSVVCYADDTLVLAQQATYRQAAILATAGVAQVVARIRRLGLNVALEKAEAVTFHGPRKAPPSDAHLVVGGTRIGMSGTMKYLGLVLDSRWRFKAHFERLVPRLLKVAASLSGLLPNVGGPGMSCRRLYSGVVRAMALYGAPVWADGLDRDCVALLRRAQRVMAVRIIRGYRTISGEAACVLAGALPWDLDAVSLASVFCRRRALASGALSPAPQRDQTRLRREREAAIAEWANRLEHPSAGQWTIGAVRPVLHQWMDRKHGVLTFRATQVLSGHGCFGGYLCRIAGREPSPCCHHCADCEDESASHALQECSSWEEERTTLRSVVGPDLSLPAVIRAMVGSERCWDAVLAFCEAVISQKEEAERVREEVSELPLRRKRTGRRRLAHDRRLPP